MTKPLQQMFEERSPNVNLCIILKCGEKITCNFTKTSVPFIMQQVIENKPDNCITITTDGIITGVIRVSDISAVLTPA